MKRVTVEIVDDIDGTPIKDGAGRTVSFVFDGQAFEIDLSNDNVQRLRSLLEPYISVARPGKARQRASTFKNAELQLIRDWATEHGIHVSDRGRIAESVRKAYEASR